MSEELAPCPFRRAASPEEYVRGKALEEAVAAIRSRLGEEGDREGYYKGRQDGLIEALAAIRALSTGGRREE